MSDLYKQVINQRGNEFSKLVSDHTSTKQIPLPAPKEIKDWLITRGYGSSSEYGYWYLNEDYPALTWEQALAVEFYKFITIGGDGSLAKD